MPSSRVTHRMCYFGHPAFLTSALVLGLNDHFLKGWFPGWWTGKLSDFAGLIVVSMIAAMIIGPKSGVVSAGVAFAALKLVPGVAESLAPVLGGVTRRDPSDLLALLVLPPTWLLVRRSQDPDVRLRRPRRPHTASLRPFLTTLAPLAGILLATATTTATSCTSDPAVATVLSEGQTLYAMVAGDSTPERWARSVDGGRTWHSSARPGSAPPSISNQATEADPGPTGSQTACNEEGTCWRLRDQNVIERVGSDGGTVDELVLTETVRKKAESGCFAGTIGIFSSIALVEKGGATSVAVSLGREGILLRGKDSVWVPVSVLDVPPAPPSTWETGSSSAVLVFAPLLAVVIWLVGRRRWPSWTDGLIVTAVGSVLTIMLGTTAQMFSETSAEGARFSGRISLAGMVLTTVAALVIAHRHRPRSAPLGLAPPPIGAYSSTASLPRPDVQSEPAVLGVSGAIAETPEDVQPPAQ